MCITLNLYLLSRWGSHWIKLCGERGESKGPLQTGYKNTFYYSQVWQSLSTWTLRSIMIQFSAKYSTSKHQACSHILSSDRPFIVLTLVVWSSLQWFNHPQSRNLPSSESNNIPPIVLNIAQQQICISLSFNWSSSVPNSFIKAQHIYDLFYPKFTPVSCVVKRNPLYRIVSASAVSPLWIAIGPTKLCSRHQCNTCRVQYIPVINA